MWSPTWVWALMSPGNTMEAESPTVTGAWKRACPASAGPTHAMRPARIATSPRSSAPPGSVIGRTQRPSTIRSTVWRPPAVVSVSCDVIARPFVSSPSGVGQQAGFEVAAHSVPGTLGRGSDPAAAGRLDAHSRAGSQPARRAGQDRLLGDADPPAAAGLAPEQALRREAHAVKRDRVAGVAERPELDEHAVAPAVAPRAGGVRDQLLALDEDRRRGLDQLDRRAGQVGGEGADLSVRALVRAQPAVHQQDAMKGIASVRGHQDEHPDRRGAAHRPDPVGQHAAERAEDAVAHQMTRDR